MPSKLGSTTGLQVMNSPREEAKLRLATSIHTPSSSSTSPRKRKLSTAHESDSVAVNPKSLKMPQPSKRTCSRFPPPPLEMPTTLASGATDAEPTEATSPPSPVPTEIIDVEAEDFVRTAQRYGVKVRDYAVDPPAPPLPRVAELWMNPVHTLLVHDMHIRRPAERDLCLPGKQLRRLLDIGYVTQKEADAYWTEEDKLLLKEYDERPDGHYPYVIAFKGPKPTAAFRVSAREIVYGMSRPGDIPDARIEVPDDGTWEGDEESWAFAARMKQDMERFVAPGMRVGSECVPPLGLIESQSRPSIFPLPVKTPPVHTVSLPHTPTSKQQGECEPAAKSNEPSTPTTPPVATTPTTPTSPPPTAPQPSNSRRLGRTATLAAIPVR